MRQTFKPADGKLAVIFEKVAEHWVEDLDIVKIEDTKKDETRVNPWALVVGVGNSRVTDSGKLITTDIEAGDRVAVSMVGRDLPLLSADGQVEYVYVLPFEGVLGRLEWACEKCKWSMKTEPEDMKCPQCPSIVAPTMQEKALVNMSHRRRR